VCCHIHDRAAMLLHRLQKDLAHHQKAAGEIGRDNGVEPFFIDEHQGRGKLSACIIDEPMDAPVLCCKPRHQRLYCILIADVDDGILRLSAIRSDLGCNILKLSLLAANKDNRRTEARKLMRRAPPNATAAARDDMRLAYEKLWPKHAPIAFAFSHAMPLRLLF